MEIIPEAGPAILLFLPFAVTYAVLHVVLFKPLLAYLDEREQVSGAARAEAESYEQATADTMARIEEALAAARRDIGELRKQARAEAARREAEVIAEARAASEAEVARAVEEIARARKQAATTLKGTAKVLSTDIAEQVLGRPARGGVA